MIALADFETVPAGEEGAVDLDSRGIKGHFQIRETAMRENIITRMLQEPGPAADYPISLRFRIVERMGSFDRCAIVFPEDIKTQQKYLISGYRLAE
ncbi:hypothetical protein [Rhizobium sophoriradicis]|uniref:hypothetical protein n=1 Tax=Rhizobium sophoriradicis TaxID=1535245 RepID=UPI00117BCDF1|nr:hypothetical protein [Rhizobium sophoriradicis]